MEMSRRAKAGTGSVCAISEAQAAMRPQAERFRRSIRRGL